MAFRRKRVPTFGREDHAAGLRVLLRGQTFFIRFVAFVIAAAVFLLVVSLTHKGASPLRTVKDSVASNP